MPGYPLPKLCFFGVRFMRFALGDNCAAEARSEVFGEFVKRGVTVNLNGLFCGVADDIAVVAPREVSLEFCLGPGIERAVQIIG